MHRIAPLGLALGKRSTWNNGADAWIVLLGLPVEAVLECTVP